MTGLAAAFKEFQAKGKNKRWSWSARSDDDKTVVITYWSDVIKFEGNNVLYDTFGLDTGNWENKNGNRERIENLKWSQLHCEGKLAVVITVAKDKMARPREIADSYARKDIQMVITGLNKETGEFSAINVKA